MKMRDIHDKVVRHLKKDNQECKTETKEHNKLIKTLDASSKKRK